MRIMPMLKHFLFASCGPQNSNLLGVTLIRVYGLNLPEVEKLFLPSLSSFLIWTSRLKSNTTFNWTCIISLSQHPTSTKKDSIT